MFSIDTRSRVPIYEQIVQNIISLISKGVLAGDDQLPSVRSLARDIGINPNTVQKAYQELELRGLIYQAAGRGSFICPGENLTKAVLEQHLKAIEEPMRAARKAGVSKEAVIKLTGEIYKEEI
ncbi:GntR family transcriptional regulator [Oscillospiraceae bacterium LTW-04]|nr:GntR family transcriptional regulator [Oscillospiraceae bacterium MB24-C1]